MPRQSVIGFDFEKSETWMKHGKWTSVVFFPILGHWASKWLSTQAHMAQKRALLPFNDSRTGNRGINW